MKMISILSGSSRVKKIEGMQMWLQKWTPDFKPNEDLPIAPVWSYFPLFLIIYIPGVGFKVYEKV